MAKAVINLQKESGGIVKISPVDGIGVTEVTVPESGELATKEYADLKVALTDFIGANQNLSQNGYQKLPGGLIIQWTQVTSLASGIKTFTFPIAFPNEVFGVYATHYFGASPITTAITPAIGDVTLSQASIAETDTSFGHNFAVYIIGR